MGFQKATLDNALKFNDNRYLFKSDLEVAEEYTDDNTFWLRDEVNGYVYLKESTDYVGLGTSAPDSNFHVYKTTAGAVAALNDTIVTIENSSHAYLRFKTAALAYSGIVFSSPISSNYASILGNDLGGDPHPIIEVRPNLFMQNQSPIYFDSFDSYIKANTDNPEDLEIHADQDLLLRPDGYVGINTVDPVSLLEMYNSSADVALTITAAHDTDYDPQIVFRTDSTPSNKYKMRVDGTDDDLYIERVGGDGDVNVITQNGSFTIGDGGTTDYASFDGLGHLEFHGGGDYLVASNAYAFRAVADQDAGVYFNGAGLAIELMSLEAVAFASFDVNNENSWLGDHGSGNYAQVTVGGVLSFWGTGDYFVRANKYAFRNQDYGLFFQATPNPEYQFKDSGGNNILMIDADNFHVVLEKDSVFYKAGVSGDVGWGFDATDMIVDYDLLNSGTTDFRIQEDGTDRFSITTGSGEVQIDSSGYVRTDTTRYRRYYHLALGSFDPGASGATWVSATANNLCGWFLDNTTEVLEFQSDVHSDWDSASDLQLEVKFQLAVAGNNNDTVDLQLICYYMGVGDSSTKTQTIEIVTVTDGTQYKMYKATFPINYDEVSNVIDVGDSICFVLNLEATSDIGSVLITDVSINYNTTHIGIESGDT